MTSPRPYKIVAVVIGFCFSFTLALAAPVKFDIPAGPALVALKVFIKQSGQQVVFNTDDLQAVTTNEVKGEFEPALALDALLKGTGFAATKKSSGVFTVKKMEAPVTTGAVRGSLTGEGGKGLPDVLVAIKETAQSTETDRYGVFAFPNVAAGTYVLVASAPGYQTMHITDVQVKAGRELTIGKEEMRKASEGPLALEPFVVRGETVEQLEKVIVTDSKPKPFSDRNVDIPRGINDVQPYYIFGSQKIEQSGATNVEEFLKQRLTMDTTLRTNAQTNFSFFGNPNSYIANGNTSSVNLRGLGSNETLVLVNGRRVAGVALGGPAGTPTSYGQTDINGIPLAAIDRIEVLPSSASGIYGGGALGGVINIVLKKEYAGGEIKATYDTTWDGHAPIRSFEATFGASLNGGKTNFLITTQFSDSKPLYFKDRLDVYNHGITTLLRNFPSYYLSGNAARPPLGSTVNIQSVNGSNLTLVSTGASLNSPIATLPAGFVYTSPDSLAAAVIPGQYNLTPPDVNETPTGLRQPLGSFPRTKSVLAQVNHRLSDQIEVFADFSYLNNRTTSTYNPFTTSGGYVIYTGNPSLAFVGFPANPYNPFNQYIRVSFPITINDPYTTDSQTRSFTVGAKIKLPREWTGEIDYEWSENSFVSSAAQGGSDFNMSGTSIDVLGGGPLNPFDESPQGLSKLAAGILANLRTNSVFTRNYLNVLGVRAAGPLFHLPWGDPTLAWALEHDKQGSPDEVLYQFVPADPVYSATINGTFGQSQTTNSAYAEATIPIVTRLNAVPLIRAIDWQMSGRTAESTIGTGTTGYVTYPNYPGGSQTSLAGPTLNGVRYNSTAKYTTTNETIGVRYMPTEDITMRVSYATAFLPPNYNQLTRNPTQNITNISDPQLGNSNYNVTFISGGNPNLKPQTSGSWVGGLIWEPKQKALKGLRVDLEYSAINQINAITSPSSTLILTNPTAFANRITRDPTTGKVTLLDLSTINLYKYQSNYWDLSIDYRKETSIGTFDLYALGTVNEHVKQQISITTPLIELVGFPNEGGVAKVKGNVSLSWAYRHWTLAWTAEYFGPYWQNGAVGDPYGARPSIIKAQGSDRIPSQVYHDLFVGYFFDKKPVGAGTTVARWTNDVLSNLTVQVGVKNIFNTLPAFDAAEAPFYSSYYGNIRLRDLSISIKKSF